MSEKRCYTVAEVQEILGVGRQAVVSLLKKKEFSWVKLTGGAYRISKGSFDRCLDGQENYSVSEDDENLL